jgi:NADH-quinone oxidoreductase subunit A
MMGENVQLLWGLFLFALAGTMMILVALTAGRFLRPNRPHPERDEPYECGEPVVGSSWVQFDLRFYVVALVFVIFDIEIALFFPWAVIYREAGFAGLVDMLFFFGVIVVGYLYLWRFGYLDWVRSMTAQDTVTPRSTDADRDLARAARTWE